MQETVPAMVAYDDAELRGLPDTWGMAYSNGLPQEIEALEPYYFAAQHTPPPLPCPPYCFPPPGAPPGVHPAVMGSILSHLRHAVTTPFRAAAQVVDTAVSTPFNVAARIANTPFALASRASSILPGASPDGGGSPAPAPAAAPPPPDAPPDGGGDPNMSVDSSGHWFAHPAHHHHMRHRHPAMSGFGLPSWLHNPFSSTPGKLLVSTVPGGATALQARDIANKALKSGDLKPEHVKAAAAVTRAAKKGDPKAVAKIANVRKRAAAGDPHAEVALDRMKLVHAIDTGGKLKAGGRSAISHAYNTGLASLPRYGRRGAGHF